MKTHSDPFNCLNCGCCCLQVGMPPFTGQEINLLPKEIKKVIQFHWRNDQDRPYGNPCYFFNFKTCKCAIYDNRPNTCRDYEAGSEDCRDVRRRRFVLRWQFQMVLSRMATDKLSELWGVRKDIENDRG